MTLEQLGQMIKTQNPTYAPYQQYGDGFLGMVAASKNPQYKTQLDPSQTSRIPANIDQHIAMFKQAIADQNPQPAAAPADDTGGPLNSGVLPQFATGVDKSVIGTVGGIGTLGMKLGNWMSKIPGLGYLYTDPNGAAAKSVDAVNAAAQPSNDVQGAGKITGDMAQFFIPGGAEADAVKGISAGVDAGKIGNMTLDYGKIADVLGPKAPDIIKGILKVAGAGAASATSMAAVTAAETGGNKAQTEQAAGLGAVGGSLTEALSMAAPALGKALQRADFKLSPVASAKASKVADDAASFMQTNKILGSESSKYRQLSDITGNLESTLQKSIPDLKVPKTQIVDGINQGVEVFQKSNPAVYQVARADADEAIKTLQKDPSAKITTEDTLNGKRSWGQRAFNTTKYKTQNPTVSSEGAYAVEMAYQKAFSDSLDRVGGTIKLPSNLQDMFGGKSEVGIDEFNSIYSKAINSRNLTMMAQKNLDTGLVGRMFGIFAGRMLGEAIMPGVVGEVAGMTVGEIASKKALGLIRNVGEKVAAGSGTPGVVAKAATQLPKVIQGSTNEAQQSQ